MANLSIPIEERNLTPQQVDALDARRRRGTLLLTIAGQFTVISVLLSLWAGSDLVWSPGWAKPIDIYFALAVTIVLVAGSTGIYLRRGAPEFE
jgi:hypothetical protein